MAKPTMIEDMSHATIKKVVEEGLEARNLLNFIADGSVEGISKKPPRPHSVSPNPVVMDAGKVSDPAVSARNSKRQRVFSRPKSRWRSASAGRNPEKDLRARYWTFLFENLRRAVDEIYQTCEMDESIVESKEAIMMLENYAKEFHALIQYININKDYEKTAPPNRPTSLAWEVRKSSPGKSFLKNVFIEKLTTGNSTAKRILSFDSPSEFASPVEVKEVPKISLSAQDSHNISIPVYNPKSEIKTFSESSSQHTNAELKYDVTVSVVSDLMDEVFSCNNNLAVNQVICENNAMDTMSSRKDRLLKDSLSEDVAKNTEKDVSSKSSEINSNENTIKNLSHLQPTSEISTVDTTSGDEPHSTEISSHGKIGSEKNLASNLNKSASVNKMLPKSNMSISNDGSSYRIEKNYKRTFTSSSSQTDSCLSKKCNASSQSKMSIAPDAKRLDTKNSVRVAKINGNALPKASLNPDKKEMPKTKAADRNIMKTSVVSSVPKSCDVTSGSKMNEISEVCSNNQSPKIAIDTQTSAPIQTNSSTKIATNFVKSCDSNLCVQKNTSTNPPALMKTKVLPKSSVKPSIEIKKTTKPSYSESAIKRNISYVSSLSSKNQKERLESSVKKPASRIAAERLKLSQKIGSMPSLNKPSSASSLSRKTASVEKIPEILKSTTDDDSDGWEMVRGRNRCRNSPAKKVPFTKQNQENQAIKFAKLSQARIGGFPYTTKVNGKIVNKNSQKTSEKKTSNQESKVEKNTKTFEKLPEKQPLSKAPNESGNASNGNHADSKRQNKNPATSGNLKSDKLLEKELLRLPQEVMVALKTKKFPANFKSTNFGRSRSTPCLNSGQESNLYTLSKTLCISNQYLGTQKYTSVVNSKKKHFDKCVNYTKRRAKKAKTPENSYVEKKSSFDESDNGLTSDDQDGQLSHDEAFDVQCQELDDAAWKYKILEQQVLKLELSWGEQMDNFDMELRTPGRALEMHEKLSSPFRKKSLFESIRVCNEKQVKAQEQRERLLVEKAQKFKIIQKKRLEMKNLIEQRQEKQRILMEQKLQRAEEKRKKQLQMIIRKAHDEEEKVNEIAFINSLEAQNKRHDLISKEKDHEARLHDIQEERQRKQEEKAAKEAAAESRRKILEAERQARLTEMQEKRKIKDHKVEQLFLVKEKERQELASQKARDRELRLSALNAQQQSSIEELQKKIQLKQEESARRHEENMEQIRQKAFELSIRKCSSNNDDVPQPLPYERKKICTMCNVLIGSEVYLLSHLHGKKHQEAVKVQYQGQDPSAEELELYNLKHIVDAPTDQLDPNIAFDKERQKALKKRCKKLRQRMSNRGQEYETKTDKSTESLNSSLKTILLRMEKIINDIKKLSVALEEGSNDANLVSTIDRILNEIITIYQKKLHENKSSFKMIGGVTALVNLFGIISNPKLESTSFVYKKTLLHLSVTAEAIIENSCDLCEYILYSNKIGSLIDFLIHRLNNLVPDNISQLIMNQGKSVEKNIPMDLTSGRLLQILTSIFTSLAEKNEMSSSEMNDKENKSTDYNYRIQDLISYIVSIGIVDKLSQFFHCIQGPLSNDEEVVSFLLDGIAFVTALIKLNSNCFSSATNQKMEDSTQLIATFRVTNMVGSVSLLYGLLLHSGVTSRSEETPPPLPKQIEILAFSTLCMLNHMAVMSLQAFQSILGSEGLSLQLRHITSHLLWYCSHLTCEPLLHEVILLIGYFTVLNPENQSLIQAGQRPTVLQQLCCLPFLYFSDIELTDILFPTLIACCYNDNANKTILQQEMTSELLSNYLEVKYLNGEENSKDNKRNIHNKRWLFSVRFPKCHWSSAKHYFSAE